MRRIVCFFHFVIISCSYPLHNPFEYLYPLAYPSSSAYSDLNYYAPQAYAPYIHPYSTEFNQDFGSSSQDFPPTLNIMAELPYAMSREFSVVPLFVVSKNFLNMIFQGQITSISQEQPTMTIRSGNRSIRCTPAVRIVLEKPIIVGSLRSNVMFPTEVQIIHEGVRIPIRIGAVIAPVLPEAVVSRDTPIAVRVGCPEEVVYAVPTKPIKITITIEQAEFSNPDISAQEGEGAPPVPSNEAPGDAFGALNKPIVIDDEDAVITTDQETVVVDSEPEQPPKNITVVEFPDEEAEPQIVVDEEDEELVNRNPPQVLAPAGIVQSTQPQTVMKPFHNDKDSQVLDAMIAEANRRKFIKKNN